MSDLDLSITSLSDENAVWVLHRTAQKFKLTGQLGTVEIAPETKESVLKFLNDEFSSPPITVCLDSGRVMLMEVDVEACCCGGRFMSVCSSA